MGLRIGGITFSGISSGFPTDEIIEQLLELEQRPIDLLEGRKGGLRGEARHLPGPEHAHPRAA